MKNVYLKWFLILLLLPPFTLKGQEITELKLDGVNSNVFLDNPNPIFSWKLISNHRGEKQTAYQIMMVCDHNSENGLRWVSKTKKITSANSINVPYIGTSLSSCSSYYWKVRIWNKDGIVSNWSKEFHFSTALINRKDWKAKWISASKWFMPIAYRPKGLEVSPKGGWADVDLKKPYKIDSVKIFADEMEQFPAHFNIEVADNLLFIGAQTIVDHTVSQQNKNRLTSLTFPFKNLGARFLRLQIIGDTSKKSDFTVRQLEVYSDGKNVALQKFTREYGTNWSRGHAVFLVDGKPNYRQDNVCPKNACPTTTAPIFRKQFNTNKKIKRATLYYASFGMVDVYINGRKIGNQVLAPRFSDYNKRIYYVAKDVTGAINLGQNVLGAMLANGFYNPPGRGFGKRQGGNGEPKFILQTNIEFTDGSKKIIVSDDSWKWNKSEVVFNDVWLGFTEDRTQLQTGWKKPKFNDQQWLKAKIKGTPTEKLQAFTGNGIQVLDTIIPIKINIDTIFFKNQIAGWPRIKLNGVKGQTITITGLSEGIKLPILTFKLAKSGETILQPNFLIFAGTNQLKIAGLKTPPKLGDVSILQIAEKLQSTSAFECSNTYFNQLFEVTKRTYQNYVYDIPADPAREKQGWTQDAQNMFNSAAYLFDVENYYKKWWQDMADNQDEQGYIGSVVPVVNRQVYDWNSPWWSGASVFLPFELYKYYGDTLALKSSYPTMRKYVDFLEKMTTSGEGKNWNAYPYFNGNNTDTTASKGKLLIWNGAGDWQNPYTSGEFAVPAPMSTMPAFFKYAQIISQVATILKDTTAINHYQKLAKEIQDRFNKKYLNAVNGVYGNASGNQTAQVLPFAVGLVSGEEKGKVYEQLLKAIQSKDNHIGTGFVATPFLLQVLARNQESKIANQVVNKKDYPGWNTLIKEGVLKENWKGEGVQMPSIGGSVVGWLIESVLGIQPDSSSVAFQKFIVAPQPDKETGLIWAKGNYDIKYGRITVEWKLLDKDFHFKLGIPANTEATVFIPAESMASVLEGNKKLACVDGIKIIGFKKGKVILQLQSGRYFFVSKISSL